MANRRDLMQSAERLVARGKLPAAVKEYRKVLSSDPGDINTLNRLGDLYARLKQNEEAVELFRQIAEHYTRDGFFVKAIAIFKKILRLDPTQFDIYETLAQLYHRQGLVSEARAQYAVVADYHRQHGNVQDAVRVHQKMVELEPDRLTHRVKLAELFHEEERGEEAVKQYARIAELMLDHGRVEEATKVYLKAIEIDADNLGLVTDAVLALRERSHSAAAETVLAAAIERNPEAANVGRLTGLGSEATLDDMEPEVVPHSGPPPGHEERRGQAPPPVSVPTIGLPEETPPPASDEAPVETEIELDFETFDEALPPETPETLPVEEEVATTDLDIEALERSVEEMSPQPDSGDADFLAEAEVFVKYGLVGKAVDRLETALEANPGNHEAGARLVELLTEQGETARVAELMERLAGQPGAAESESWRRAREALEAAEAEAPVAEVEAAPVVPDVVAPVGDEEAPGNLRIVADIEWLEQAATASSKVEGAADGLFDAEEEFFDLAAELERELGLETAADDGDDGDDDDDVESVPEQSLQEIVEGFKKGIEEALSPEDYDTHYNLGIAYREMGLIDEAIGEFQLAAKDPRHLVDCSSMLAYCFMEKGFSDLAIKWYRRGLDSEELTDEERAGLLYELANLQLTINDREAAFETFVEIYGMNSNYRDVVARIEEFRAERE